MLIFIINIFFHMINMTSSFFLKPGWAATLKFNVKVREQFNNFRNDATKFSLGVCNGCQLMGLLGWIAPLDDGLCMFIQHAAVNTYLNVY